MTKTPVKIFIARSRKIMATSNKNTSPFVKESLLA